MAEDRLNALMQATVDKIAAAIEEGAATGNWSPPWRLVAGNLHQQAENGRPYRGGNQLLLMITAVLDGYEDPRWATYRTWRHVGAQVRKGEHGTRLVKWGKFSVCEEHGSGRTGCGCPQGRTRLYANGFTVFNAAQVDGAPERETPDVTWDPVEQAEKLVAGTGAHIVHANPAAAFFMPAIPGQVNVPPREAFDTATKFYGTLFHELVHWSGHESRLDRDLQNRFGTDAYAGEELIAEIGAAFLGAKTRLAVDAHMDAAEYLASWLKVLRAEPKRLYTAAKYAQEAADYLSGDSAEG